VAGRAVLCVLAESGGESRGTGRHGAVYGSRCNVFGAGGRLAMSGARFVVFSKCFDADCDLRLAKVGRNRADPGDNSASSGAWQFGIASGGGLGVFRDRHGAGGAVDCVAMQRTAADGVGANGLAGTMNVETQIPNA